MKLRRIALLGACSVLGTGLLLLGLEAARRALPSELTGCATTAAQAEATRHHDRILAIWKSGRHDEALSSLRRCVHKISGDPARRRAHLKTIEGFAAHIGWRADPTTQAGRRALATAASLLAEAQRQALADPSEEVRARAVGDAALRARFLDALGDTRGAIDALRQTCDRALERRASSDAARGLEELAGLQERYGFREDALETRRQALDAALDEGSPARIRRAAAALARSHAALDHRTEALDALEVSVDHVDRDGLPDDPTPLLEELADEYLDDHPQLAARAAALAARGRNATLVPRLVAEALREVRGGDPRFYFAGDLGDPDLEPEGGPPSPWRRLRAAGAAHADLASGPAQDAAATLAEVAMHLAHRDFEAADVQLETLAHQPLEGDAWFQVLLAAWARAALLDHFEYAAPTRDQRRDAWNHLLHLAQGALPAGTAEAAAVQATFGLAQARGELARRSPAAAPLFLHVLDLAEEGLQRPGSPLARRGLRLARLRACAALDQLDPVLAPSARDQVHRRCEAARSTHHDEVELGFWDEFVALLEPAP